MLWIIEIENVDYSRTKYGVLTDIRVLGEKIWYIGDVNWQAIMLFHKSKHMLLQNGKEGERHEETFDCNCNDTGCIGCLRYVIFGLY